MSIKHAADYIRSQGRNNDTQLMHVTPNELGGLQSLAMAHGGSLTLNPITGLPEAGFLEDILPTIAGIGVGIATGNPMIGAAVAGGGATALTGSLEKGLIAGLGAYGGSGMLTSLGAAGAGAAGASSTLGAAGAGIGGSTIPTVAQLGAQAAGTGIGAGIGGATGAAGIGGATGAGAAGAGIGGSSVPTVAQIGSQAATSALNPAQQFASLPVADKFSAVGEGFGNLMSDPSGTFGQMGGLAGQGKNMMMAAAPILAASPEQSSPQETESYIQPYDYSQTVNPNFGMPGQSYYSDQTFTPQPQQSASSFTGFNNGGIASLAEGGEPKYTNSTKPINPAVTEYNDKLMQQANYEYNQSPQLGAFQSALPGAGAYNEQAGIAYQADRAALAEKLKDSGPNQFGYQYNPETGMVDKVAPPVVEDTSQNNFVDYYGGMSDGNNFGWGSTQNAAGGQIKRMADGGDTGGITSLGGYSDGGQLLRGPGDGVSDDIPASIEGRQPARLADGEFVFPARIVSEIGNGSTDAGAKRLYAMMDAIENRRKQSMKDIAADTQAYKELVA